MTGRFGPPTIGGVGEGVLRALAEREEAAIRDALLGQLCGPWGRVPGEGRLVALMVDDPRLAFWPRVRLARMPTLPPPLYPRSDRP